MLRWLGLCLVVCPFSGFLVYGFPLVGSAEVGLLLEIDLRAGLATPHLDNQERDDTADQDGEDRFH